MEYINYYLSQVDLFIHNNPYLMMYLSVVTFIYFASVLMANLINIAKVKENHSIPLFSILFCSLFFPVIIMFFILLGTVFKKGFRNAVKVVEYEDKINKIDK